MVNFEPVKPYSSIRNYTSPVRQTAKREIPKELPAPEEESKKIDPKAILWGIGACFVVGFLYYKYGSSIIKEKEKEIAKYSGELAKLSPKFKEHPENISPQDIFDNFSLIKSKQKKLKEIWARAEKFENSPVGAIRKMLHKSAKAFNDRFYNFD